MKNLFLTVLVATAVAGCTKVPTDINNDKVFYAFDSAVVSDDARKDLTGQALYMKKNPNTTVTLEGHCDERGSTEYNLALGALRAGNAAHVLYRNGIEEERVKTISYGKEHPQYLGTGEAVWAKNRNATTKVSEK